MQKEKVILQYS